MLLNCAPCRVEAEVLPRRTNVLTSRMLPGHGTGPRPQGPAPLPDRISQTDLQFCGPDQPFRSRKEHPALLTDPTWTQISVPKTEHRNLENQQRREISMGVFHALPAIRVGAGHDCRSEPIH